MSRAKSWTRRSVFLPQVLMVATLWATSPRPAVAADEDDPPSRVARLSYLRGPVSFQPAGESEWVEAIANRPLTTGDRLWTDSGARAELNTGSATIRLDASTDFSFLNLDDRTVQVQLTQGTVTVRLLRLREDELVEVDTPNQAFSIQQPGSYRVEASEDGNSTLVTVRAGEGEAYGGGETYTVYSGQSTRFTGTDSLDASVFHASRADDFDEWGQSRDRRADASRSARYVSHDVVGYEDLDDNGTWSTDPSYGNVWVPTRVASGWAPYHDGHWAWISPWGYTWVDDAPWGYAPFHYGRWVIVGGRWAWVPGPVAVRAVYAPALVAFIGGPGFGLSLSVGGGAPRAEVGWFPLGPREVYVPSYHVSRAYVERVNVSNTTVSSTTVINVYNTQITGDYRTTSFRYVNRTAPGAVTVVPQQAFTSAQPVARAAVTVNVQRIASAPVGRAAIAAPTRNSVFGIAASRAVSAPRPPPAALGRSVVARVAPPPPPVPFERQQRALEARPGQPLARQELERVRPRDAAAPRPLVRLAPPGRPATARDERTPAVQKERGPQEGIDQRAQAAPPANVPVSPAPPARPDRPSAAPFTPPTRPLAGEGLRPPTAPPSQRFGERAAPQKGPREEAAQQPRPPKAAAPAAQPPRRPQTAAAPVAEPPQRKERPAPGAVPRAKPARDEKEKREGKRPPAAEAEEAPR